MDSISTWGDIMTDDVIPMARRTSATESEGSDASQDDTQTGIIIDGVHYVSTEAALIALTERKHAEDKLEAEKKKKKEMEDLKKEAVQTIDRVEEVSVKIASVIDDYKGQLSGDISKDFIKNMMLKIYEAVKLIPKIDVTMKVAAAPNSWAARAAKGVKVTDSEVETGSVSSDNSQDMPAIQAVYKYQLPPVEILKPTSKMPTYHVSDGVVKAYKDLVIKELSKNPKIEEFYKVYEKPLSQDDLNDLYDHTRKKDVELMPDDLLETEIKPTMRRVFTSLLLTTLKYSASLNVSGYVLYPYLMRSENNYILFEMKGTNTKYRAHLDWMFHNHEVREDIFACSSKIKKLFSKKVKLVSSRNKEPEFRPTTETFKDIVTKMGVADTVMNKNYGGNQWTAYYGHLCGFHISDRS
jgi:hypothetical protein